VLSPQASDSLIPFMAARDLPPGIFDPDALLRRDQAASMVTRLLDRLVQHALLAQG